MAGEGGRAVGVKGGGWAAGAMGLCGLIATLFTGAMIPHCSSQSRAEGLAQGRAEAAADLDAKSRHITTVEGQLNQDRAVINALEVRIDGLSEDVEAIRSELEGCRAGLRAVEATGDPDAALVSERDRLLGELASAREALNGANAERARAASELEALRAQLASVTGERDALQRGAVGGGDGGGEGAAGVPAGALRPTEGAPLVWESGGMRLELVSCRGEVGSIVCEASVTSVERDRSFSVFGDRRSTIVDPEGRNISASSASLGDKTGSGTVSLAMTRGVTVRMQVRFQVSGPTPAYLPKITLGTGVRPAEFRDIAVDR